MGALTRTALAIDTDLLARFEKWMAEHGYTNRSEAVRDLIRSALIEQEWSRPQARVIATLSIVYDHERRDLAQHLTRLQHSEHRAILCSQHVHLDAHTCLEVIILQGRAAQLRRTCDAIIATAGVKAGKLTLLSASV